MIDHDPVRDIRTAAENLRNSPTLNDDALLWWLIETVMRHVPRDGRTCERDDDPWPCEDILSAQKVAETVNIEAPAGGQL
ncbi:hypothetical protein ACFQ2B_27640 [Streptomyces stramineus]|uniref:Uncharacterized protein n=1 Tax=Streptomyces stramineus TaxID=173861 RepID=A0ABN0ZNK9_9ACTN